MSYSEYNPRNPSILPEVIQGGMGVNVSDWRLATSVARRKDGMGMVSGVGAGEILARKLQDGDGGEEKYISKALERFPDQNIVDEIFDRYYIPNGRRSGVGYNLVPKFTGEDAGSITEKLNIAGAFALVTLAKMYSNGFVGLNLLTKIKPPTMSALFGAELAGADAITMGAGIPKNIPEMLDKLKKGEPVRDKLDTIGAKTEHYIEFDPGLYPDLVIAERRRPQFLAIVSSYVLAKVLATGDTPPDGFIVENHKAGGHNAPARSKQLTDDGQPIYGPKDDVDFEKIAELRLPFWVGGGYGNKDGLKRAREIGANGIQVGTAFAFANESGLDSELKQQVINQVLSGVDLKNRTDSLASPSGYPFKVVGLDNTLSESEVYRLRRKVCDLGYLSEAYEKSNGTVGWRCPAEPEKNYEMKGGTLEEMMGRICICNALFATAGMPQIRKEGKEIKAEPPIITAGDDINRVIRALATKERPYYTVDDMMNYLGANL